MTFGALGRISIDLMKEGYIVDINALSLSSGVFVGVRNDDFTVVALLP